MVDPDRVPEPVSLDEASIIAEAREKAGLSDFGDESFLEPMHALLESLEHEAQLNAGGRIAQRMRIVDLLVNRLRAEDHFKRHPEILEERIDEPFVIVGLARTGTTMLHRLIASDPRINALAWWESRNPAPFPETNYLDPDPRIADAEEQVRVMLEGSPELASIHPMDAKGPDEEIMLLEHSFFSTNPEAFAEVPSYAAWLDERDQTAGYEYLKKLLQFLQWQKRRAGTAGRRWVLKTPHHLGFMDLLFKVFPDVKVIQTHRDPLQTVPSLASMICAIRILASDRVDPKRVGRHWGDKMARAVKRCTEVRDAVGGERFIDVWYKDVVVDPMAQVRRIYDFIGMQLTPGAEQCMLAWIGGNPRERRAAHSYTLEEFGYTEDGIKAAFAGYRERFILGRD